MWRNSDSPKMIPDITRARSHCTAHTAARPHGTGIPERQHAPRHRARSPAALEDSTATHLQSEPPRLSRYIHGNVPENAHAGKRCNTHARGVTAQVVTLFVVQQLGGGITVKHPQLQHTETSGLSEVCHRPSTLHRSETHSHPAAAARHGAHTALTAARAAKFHRTAHSRRPGGSLPFSSSDTVDGSAQGNNPENRARKASRKNSDMFSESGL